MTKKRLRMFRYSVGLDLDVVYTYDTEGRVATVTYPGRYPGGETLQQQQYDSMGRLSVIREDLIRDGSPSYIEWANNAVYGPAGELKNLSWVIQAGTNRTTDPDLYSAEVRTYNSRLQLTGLTANGSLFQPAINLTYNYSPTANNGQITSMTNNVSGETVTYQYDALKRLISASTNTATWGQGFTYDGFGNMLTQSVTQGSAPSMTLIYDNNTNRIATAGIRMTPTGT
jgi:YD repeat-containing protein